MINIKDRLSKGNRKLSKNVLIWNLPRLITCPGADACKDWCYEEKIERMYKNVLPFRMVNLRLTKLSSFTPRMAIALSQCEEPYVRIHESGDFYSQRYLDKWKMIATLQPQKVFYAYTKSHKLDFTHMPNNVIILKSYGSKYDHLICMGNGWNTTNTARVVSKNIHPPLLIHSETLCPGKGCGSTCLYCMELGTVKHVVFEEH